MLNSQDRDAIEGLFERLEEVERRSGPRDVEAEALIRQKLARHPAASYYLAQTVVVQQEALKEAERRINELEAKGRQLEHGRGPWDREPAHNDRRPSGSGLGGGGFLAGAAQTALGVAGGMMLGNLIGSIFSTGAANAAEVDPEIEAQSGEPDAGTDNDFGGFDGGDFDIGGDF